jgi:hypothetical protein
MAIVCLVLSLLAASRAGAAEANTVELYLARWWGAPGSKRDRPIYHVARIDNGRLELRHAIVPGRPLACYRLPYWPIRSFVSIVSGQAELPCRIRGRGALGGKTIAAPFVVTEGFDLASVPNGDVLRVTNRGSGKPLRLEQWHVVRNGDPVVQVLLRATNTAKQPMRGVEMQATYEQDFNWSAFGASDGGAYTALEAPAAHTANAFYAFSAGMGRGYEVIAGEGCRLFVKLVPERNTWYAVLASSAEELAPGAAVTIRYAVRVLERPPARPSPLDLLSTADLLALPVRTERPTTYKTAPVKREGRVMLPQVIARLDRPKTRGLNLRASGEQAVKDLKTLKAWGCNLVITHLGKGDPTARRIEAGHKLGMEMFLAGRGSYRKGPPSFKALYDTPRPPAQQPDSHGQDEDHYYWYAIEPSRDFAADFDKPMGQATQAERVLYWSRCFADKWRRVLANVRPHAPRGGIWFYTPTPSVAHVDPLDHYDVLFRELAALGEPLTVFPFYYGIAYDQAEYMVRRWKDAGAQRVVFLPMRGFMARPSQFIRAITAGRRGRADGACGFNFPVGGEEPGNAWQWKAVMLGAWANFPTAELDAWCFIEEPAELVEALAESDVRVVVSGETDADEFVARLDERLPGKAAAAAAAPEPIPDGSLCVIVGGPESQPEGPWPYDPRRAGPGKGVLQMRGRMVSLCGTDAEGVAKAVTWFLRLADLARPERQCGPD